MNYKAIVIGSSAGGFNALKQLISSLPSDFSLPVIIVQHISPTSDNYMVNYLDKMSSVHVKEADEKEKIKPGHIYIAPPNYHLLIEEDHSLSLSNDEKKNYSRPSIDILFETANYAFGNQLIAVILTGANNDGAAGMKSIKENGGYCIVQDPTEAEADSMPLAAIEKADPQKVLKLKSIVKTLIKLDKQQKNNFACM